MSQTRVHDYLHSWNPAPSARLKQTRIDDDIRDGTQGAFARRPSVAERQSLIDHSVRVGSFCMVLGFPAISEKEYEECLSLVQHIERSGYGVVPIFLARLLQSDVVPIVRLKQACGLDVRAEMFLGTSPLRRAVEGWELPDMIARIHEVGGWLRSQNTRFGISAEDATRTPPHELKQVIEAVVACGATSLTICDTVGDATPEGAAQLTAFSRQCLAEAGAPDLELVWHGHNDKGLSVPNALASAAAGADVISGTFLGIGERAGNTPLEQVVFLLHEAGNRRFQLEHVPAYCQSFAALTGTPVLPMAPLVGSQAFATSAGTHSAAILKARKLGRDFEDYVFSGVPASLLGREQDIVMNATSGLVNARYMLAQLGLEVSQETAQKLLAYAKSQDRWLSTADVRAFLAQEAATAG